MGCYRPTTLKLASAHCPRAVDFYEDGTSVYREHFDTGIAAHDVLAKIGEAILVKGERLTDDQMRQEAAIVARGLIESGRWFEGSRELPMHAENAFEGSHLAVAYATRPDTVWATSGARYEVGFAYDAKWQKVPYSDPRRRFRLILDKLEIITEEGEDYAGTLAVVTDYKSAWPTDESELATYQMRAQAVAAYLELGGKIDGIRRQVVNLRTGKTYSDDLWLESGGREQIAEWQDEITAYMDALDAMDQNGRRPARPGIGCLSCHYALACDADIKGVNVGAMAQRLAKLEGERAVLIKSLKAATGERSITVGDSSIGYHVTCSRTPKDSASGMMRAAWESSGGNVSGLVTAFKPTMTTLSAVAKLLRPESKDAQAALVAEWSEEKRGKEFGITRKGGPA